MASNTRAPTLTYTDTHLFHSSGHKPRRETAGRSRGEAPWDPSVKRRKELDERNPGWQLLVSGTTEANSTGQSCLCRLEQASGTSRLPVLTGLFDLANCSSPSGLKSLCCSQEVRVRCLDHKAGKGAVWSLWPNPGITAEMCSPISCLQERGPKISGQF